jgi:hypothetical protein
VSGSNLIFDFDGVLGDTWEASVLATSTVDGTTPEETKEIILRFFDAPHHSRGQARTPSWLAEKLAWNTRYAEQIIAVDFSLFDGFITEIGSVPGARLAVVSSGMSTYMRRKLAGTGLPFTHILGFEESHSKEEKIERIAADWQADISDIYYFTDTKADVIELRELLDPARIIGCAWGYQGYDALAGLLPPEQILREFSDIRRIVG